MTVASPLITARAGATSNEIHFVSDNHIFQHWSGSSNISQLLNGDFASNVTTTLTLQSGVVESAAHVRPATAATYDLGTSALPWRSLYVGNIGIGTSATISQGTSTVLDTNRTLRIRTIVFE